MELAEYLQWKYTIDVLSGAITGVVILTAVIAAVVYWIKR